MMLIMLHKISYHSQCLQFELAVSLVNSLCSTLYGVYDDGVGELAMCCRAQDSRVHTNFYDSLRAAPQNSTKTAYRLKIYPVGIFRYIWVYY